MKHLFTLLVTFYLIFSFLHTKAQINILSGASPIDALSFCISSTETLSVAFEESKNGTNWENYFPDATGNTITLNLNNGFTFGNNSTNAVTFSNSGDIKNVSISYTSTQVITITFDHTGTNVDNLYLENIIINAPSGSNNITANFIVNSCLYNASNVAQNKTVNLTSSAPTLAITGNSYCYSSTAQDITFSCSASADVLVRDVFFPHKA